jgi:hypothetical protein
LVRSLRSGCAEWATQGRASAVPGAVGWCLTTARLRDELRVWRGLASALWGKRRLCAQGECSMAAICALAVGSLPRAGSRWCESHQFWFATLSLGLTLVALSRGCGESACVPPAGARVLRPARGKIATWLILPVVICLSQRLSHACLSINFYTVKLRMAH